MLTFIVPVDGNVEAQEQQYLEVKKSTNIQLTFIFYKDKLKTEAWDLENATIAFYAKENPQLDAYDIEKDNADSDWTKTEADDGILKLVLDTTDLGEAKTLTCEIEFTPSGSSRAYRTKNFVIEIVEDIET